jgi:hypothetical protein
VTAKRNGVNSLIRDGRPAHDRSGDQSRLRQRSLRTRRVERSSCST